MLGSLTVPGLSSGPLRSAPGLHKAPHGLHTCRPTALRRAAAPVAMAGPAHRKPAAPPRAVAQLYTAAASLPFVMSSGAIAATGAGAGHEFSGAPFSLAMAAIAVALFVGEAYQRQAAGETFDLQAVTAKAFMGDSSAGREAPRTSPSSPVTAVAVAPEPAAAPPVDATRKDAPAYYGSLMPAAAVAAAAAMRSKLATGGAAPAAKTAVPPPGAAARLAAVAAAPAAVATTQAQAPQEAASAPTPTVPADKPEALAERHADKVRLLWDDFNKARTSRAVAGQNDRGAGATTARASATSSGADGVAVLPVATAATAAVGPRVSAEPRASAAAKQTPTEAIAVARGSGSDRAVVQHKSLASRLAAMFASWWARVMSFLAALTSPRRGSASSSA